jgi:hypothetical protein
MTYELITPWEYQTWGAGLPWPDKYSRLSQRPIIGGTYTGEIPKFITDIARGMTLIVNGTDVEATLYPYQNTLQDADAYYLGGGIYIITDEAAQILINAGYEEYLTKVVPDLFFMPQAEAELAIIDGGYTVGDITTSTEGANSNNNGRVKSQSPEASTHSPQGQPIDLVLFLNAD